MLILQSISTTAPLNELKICTLLFTRTVCTNYPFHFSMLYKDQDITAKCKILKYFTDIC